MRWPSLSPAARGPPGGHTGHTRAGRRAAEAGPADMDRLRRMGKALGGRAPELGVAGGAGEEEEFGGGYSQRVILEVDNMRTALSKVDKAAPLSTLCDS